MTVRRIRPDLIRGEVRAALQAAFESGARVELYGGSPNQSRGNRMGLGHIVALGESEVRFQSVLTPHEMTIPIDSIREVEPSPTRFVKGAAS